MVRKNRWVAVLLAWLAVQGLPQAGAQTQPLGNDVCLGCHGNASFAMPRADGIERSLFVNKDHFQNSVHGQILQCANCHQNQAQVPHTTVSKSYLEWRQSIAPMCGTCHSSQQQEYLSSVHGIELMQKGNLAAATCSSCHDAHAVQRARADDTRMAMTRNCGNCHGQNLRSFLDTYHGQVHSLGYAFTAKCFDCHASHGIQRVNDPGSTVHPVNRLQTCQKCHQNATAGFVSFQPHATTTDRERYPYTWYASKFMILLLGGTFAFFWTHSVLWYYREYRDRKQQKPMPHVLVQALPQEQVYYRRWPAGWRLAHLLFALCVIGLLITGMSLFYAETFWAPALQQALGGPRSAGMIHRVLAIGFVGIFFLHLGYVAVNIARNWRTFEWFGPHSLIPGPQDLWDAIAMFKWFFGLAPRPQLDRFTYWEKFDYWAPFWGVTIIGVSGAMMWFKELTATYLPGWVLNVALIFHTEEAILAAGFLFTVHFFNNHWRPDKFPLDIQMFTGAVPLEEFKHEHTREYNRLVETGQLQKYLVERPSRPLTLASKVLGFTLMATGLMILVLMLLGFATHLGWIEPSKIAG
jgi:cytochrome b subunit of formate dehydrogenase